VGDGSTGWGGVSTAGCLREATTYAPAGALSSLFRHLVRSSPPLILQQRHHHLVQVLAVAVDLVAEDALLDESQ